MGLLGGKTKVELELEDESVRVGDAVEFRATLSGKLDDNVTEALAELVRVDHGEREFIQLVDDVAFTSVSKTEHETVVAESELIGDEDVELGDYEVSLKLPAKSPPTSPGLVTWKARVRAIRDGGRDRSAEEELLVSAKPGSHKSKLKGWQKAVETDNGPSAPELSWKLAGGQSGFEAGKPIKGELVVKPKQQLEPELISINLITDLVVEGVGCMKDIDDSAPWGVFNPIAAPDPLPAGETARIPFELVADPEAPATTSVDARSRIWYLTAWVGDAEAEEGIESFKVIELRSGA